MIGPLMGSTVRKHNLFKEKEKLLISVKVFAYPSVGTSTHTVFLHRGQCVRLASVQRPKASGL